MIYLGADHGGFKLKESIKQFLDKKGYAYKDMGNHLLDGTDDYPDFALKVAEAVAKEDDSRKSWPERPKGILFCRSSGGMEITANKVMNARAVSVFDEESARHCRRDNDANIIALAGDWVDPGEAEKIVIAFLKTEFSREERHIRRIKKISGYESRKMKV